MDEIHAKMIERMSDILDAIKVQTDIIIFDNKSNKVSCEDFSASETILNLTHSLDLLLRNVER